MNFRTHTHRHFALPLEREKRLCFVERPSDTPQERGVTKKALDAVSGAVGVIMEWTTYYTAELAAFLAKTTVSIPIGFLKGLDEAWQNNRASADIIKQDAIQAASFFRHFPLIGKYFEGMQFEDVQSYRNLTNNLQWIEAFNDLSVFNKPVIDIADRNSVTPKDMLMSLRPEERKMMYMNFTDSVIPAHVLGQNGLPVAGSYRTATERFDAMDREQHVMLNGALKGIFDATDVKAIDGRAQSMAKQALNAMYRPELALHDLPLKGLQDDYSDAIAGAGFAGLRGGRTSAANLESSVYAPATLRAALKLGVVRNEHLQFLSRGMEKGEFRESSVKGNVRHNLNVLTGIVETDRRRDALGVREIFENMSGVEKLILLGGTAWALTTRFGRGIAGAGALLYFGMKFGFKDPDPIKTASGWINNILTLNGRVPNDAMPGGPTDPRRKVDSMMAFLKEFDPQGYNRLEMQATGFSLMGDMRMSDIAQQVSIFGDPTKETMSMSLNIPGLRNGLETVRKQSKWKTSIDSFFMDPASMQELGNGFGYVFYKLASENPANFEVAQKLNDAMRKLPAALTIADLPCVAEKFSNQTMRGAALEANQLYMRLVMLGQNAASTDRRSLGDVVASLTRVPQNSPRQSLQENGVAYGAGLGGAVRDKSDYNAISQASSGDATSGEGGSSDAKAEARDASSESSTGDSKSKAGGGGADSKSESGDASSKSETPDATPKAIKDDASSEAQTLDSKSAEGSNSIPPSGSDARSAEGADAKPGEGEDSSSSSGGSSNSKAEGGKGKPPEGRSSKPAEGSDSKAGETAKAKPAEGLPESVTDLLQSLPEGAELVNGKILKLKLDGKDVVVQFNETRIIVNGQAYKLEAEKGVFWEAKFDSVRVAKNKKGELGLTMKSSIKLGSNENFATATSLETMLKALMDLPENSYYEDTTEAGTKTRTSKVKK